MREMTVCAVFLMEMLIIARCLLTLVGLAPDLAAFKLAWLLARALSLGLTGVTLKDESDRALAARGPARPLRDADGTSD